MASVFLRAFLLTVLLFGANFAFIRLLDESRATDLFNQVTALDEELQNNRVELIDAQATGNLSSNCGALAKQTLAQVDKLYELSAQLENVERSNFLGDTARVRRRFVLSNAELFAYAQLLEKSCQSTFFTPILYFYPDQSQCFECKVQAEELNKVTRACKTVRVFAFPTDSNLPALDKIRQRYGVTTYPSLVVAGKALPGITVANDLRAQVRC